MQARTYLFIRNYAQQLHCLVITWVLTERLEYSKLKTDNFSHCMTEQKANKHRLLCQQENTINGGSLIAFHKISTTQPFYCTRCLHFSNGKNNKRIKIMKTK